MKKIINWIRLDIMPILNQRWYRGSSKKEEVYNCSNMVVPLVQPKILFDLLSPTWYFLAQLKQGRIDYGTNYYSFNRRVSFGDHSRHSIPNPRSQQKIGWASESEVLNSVASAFPVACFGVSERILNDIFFMNWRFSAASCGESSIIPILN